MNKEEYYIPEPNEFCIGSIYYVPMKGMIPNRDINKLDTSKRVRIVINDLTELIELQECLDIYNNRLVIPKRWRMKYLDKEDIESLGFEYIEFCLPFKDGTKDFRKKYVKDYGKKKIEIHPIREHQYFIFETTDIHSHHHKFTGIIKNLYELKKILKMIGI